MSAIIDGYIQYPAVQAAVEDGATDEQLREYAQRMEYLAYDADLCGEWGDGYWREANVARAELWERACAEA